MIGDQGSPEPRRQKQKSFVQDTPYFLDNNHSSVAKRQKVAISHDSTHMNTELRDNLLLRRDHEQEKPGSDDSEFSADMDVASELGGNRDRGRSGANALECAIDENEEQIRVSMNSNLQELTQNRIDLADSSYVNERYTEKDIFSEDDDQEIA